MLQPVLRLRQWDQTCQISQSVTVRHQELAPFCAFTPWSPCIGHTCLICFFHHDVRLVATHCLHRHSGMSILTAPIRQRSNMIKLRTGPCQTTILRKMGHPGHPNSKQRPALRKHKETMNVEHTLINIGPLTVQASSCSGLLKNMRFASLWWRCSGSDRPCEKLESFTLCKAACNLRSA